jgi:PIN domain nuclease of toxin-antitoxin system
LKVLLDTQIVLWAAVAPERLSPRAHEILTAPDTEVTFSVVSVWEVAIKNGLRRHDFPISPDLLRDTALDTGWEELPVLARHAIAVANLPLIHGDPFDRLLVAQARVESMELVTSDRTLWRYGDPVRRV